MKTSEIFKLAKTRVWDGDFEFRGPYQEKYICNAIRFDFDIPYKNKQKALDIISTLLKEYDTLEDWMWAEHKINYWRSKSKVQKTRHAWLKHLIEHYESIGD